MSADNTKRYYCIRNPTSKQPITKELVSLAQAIKVREALKRDFPDREFHVLIQVPEDVLQAFAEEHAAAVADSE